MKRLVLILLSFCLVSGAMWLLLSEDPAVVPPEPAPAAEQPQAAHPLASAPAPVVPGGSLEGRVLRRGAAVVGARVTLREHSARVIASGEDGRFRFEDVPSGEVWLSAALEDEASPLLGPLMLASGEQRTGLVLQLELSAVVAGTVVSSQSRAPLKGARLVTSGGSGVTDANGRFTLHGLPAGLTWIEATAQGHLSRVEWLSLDSARAHTGLEVSLDPASSLAGSVRQQGSPMAGAQIWAERLIGARVGSSHGPVASARDGSWKLEVAPGLLRVVGQLADGTRIQGPRLRIEAGDERTGIDLEAGESLSVDGQVRLEGVGLPGATLTLFDSRSSEVAAVTGSGADGRFHFERVAVGRYLVQVRKGALTTQTGPFEQNGVGEQWQVDLSGSSVLAGRVEPAAAGVRVRWRSGDWAGAAAEAITDASGAFRFEGVASGVLLVEAEGEQGSAAARSTAGAAGLVLRLARGRLRVIVQDDRGAAISDFALTLVPQSGGLVRRFPVLSPNGVFALDLPAGVWRAEASADGYADGVAQTVEVRGVEAEVRLALQRAGPVQGSVRDATSRLPIRGATVSIIRLGGPPGQQFRNLGRSSGGQTDGNGEFYAPAVALPATVEVRHPSFETAWAAVPASRAGASRVEVLMKPGNPRPLGERILEYEGVGMQLSGDGARVWIAQVYENSPAELAGLQNGDLLVSIDGRPLPARIEEVVKQIVGPAGSVVKITVQRGPEALEFSVRRRAITL
ncbi:MAG: carboxyl-terminal processing protease [Myxococcaceae bacterium]|nr:carboxyl-terminal processing protease [Myxococcaceae bacterium]